MENTTEPGDKHTTLDLHIENRPDNMLGPNSYSIFIGENLGDLFAEHMERQKKKSFVIFTDQNLADVGQLEDEVNMLESHGMEAIPIIMPPGEKFKTGEQYLKHAYELVANPHVERATNLIARGGGVVCDLGGFIAGTVKRGLASFYPKATSTVSGSDSTVGGKTGVDSAAGDKNALGVFIQPNGVYIDVANLLTAKKSPYLHEAAFHSGLAEIIKYALSWDEEAVKYIEDNSHKILDMDMEAMKKALTYSVSIKIQQVEPDIGEKGRRAVCNLGHTFGHAFETKANQVLKDQEKVYAHGYCVSIGTVYAAAVSLLNPNTDFNEEGFERTVNAIKGLKLPTQIPDFMSHFDLDEFLPLMAKDKKVENGKIQFVLQNGVGSMYQVSPGANGGKYKMEVGKEIPMSHLREAFAYISR